MSQNNYIYHVDDLLNYEREKLLAESHGVNYNEFRRPDPKPGSFFNHIPEWKRTVVETNEGQKIKAQLEDLTGIVFEQHFYVINGKFTLPMHKDMGVKSALNIVLTDNNTTIEFEDIGLCKYSCAFLNVSEKRHTITTDTERRLCRFISWKNGHKEIVERLDAIRN